LKHLATVRFAGALHCEESQIVRKFDWEMRNTWLQSDAQEQSHEGVALVRVHEIEVAARVAHQEVGSEDTQVVTTAYGTKNKQHS
jgi:hypothetical protein